MGKTHRDPLQVSKCTQKQRTYYPFHAWAQVFVLWRIERSTSFLHWMIIQDSLWAFDGPKQKQRYARLARLQLEVHLGRKSAWCRLWGPFVGAKPWCGCLVHLIGAAWKVFLVAIGAKVPFAAGKSWYVLVCIFAVRF